MQRVGICWVFAHSCIPNLHRCSASETFKQGTLRQRLSILWIKWISLFQVLMVAALQHKAFCNIWNSGVELDLHPEEMYEICQNKGRYSVCVTAPLVCNHWIRTLGTGRVPVPLHETLHSYTSPVTLLSLFSYWSSCIKPILGSPYTTQPSEQLNSQRNENQSQFVQSTLKVVESTALQTKRHCVWMGLRAPLSHRNEQECSAIKPSFK